MGTFPLILIDGNFSPSHFPRDLDAVLPPASSSHPDHCLSTISIIGNSLWFHVLVVCHLLLLPFQLLLCLDSCLFTAAMINLLGIQFLSFLQFIIYNLTMYKNHTIANFGKRSKDFINIRVGLPLKGYSLTKLIFLNHEKFKDVQPPLEAG